MKLDSFTTAYIECALWSSTDDNGEPLDRLFGVYDIHPDSLAKIVAECERFQRENETPDYGSRGENNGGDAACAGHDFWLTRNGHGTGFWDRDELLEAERSRLTCAAKDFGSCDLYVGDDGKLHI